jgi:hypothetical protein
MKKYKPYLTRVDLVKNQVERERIQEQEAKRKRKQRIQEQNRQNHLRYQEQLRSEMAARYFHSVISAGGESFTNTKSILLDGVDDYVDVADADNLSFGNGTTDSPFSISFWVNLDSLSGQNNVFIGKDNGSPNREYAIGMFSNSDKVRFFIKNNGGNNQQSIDSTTQLTIGSWFHIVTTYSGVGGSNSADGMKIYINGNLEISTNVIKQSYTAMKNTTAPLTIGKYNASASQISGTMDEVSVFNTELSQSDITSIYGGGVPSSLSSYSSLVSWWRFEEGSGTTATDSGTLGNDGTLEGPPIYSTDIPS